VILPNKSMELPTQALRNCISKSSRKPAMMTTDNGKEFMGVEFINDLVKTILFIIKTLFTILKMEKSSVFGKTLKNLIITWTLELKLNFTKKLIVIKLLENPLAKSKKRSVSYPN